MKTVFADTFYYLALLNPNDAKHLAAVVFSETEKAKTVTTGWVITEVADALAEAPFRASFPVFWAELKHNPTVTVIPPTEQLFEAGIDLFTRRSDKGWSLTNCISFVTMKRLHLNEALTADRHFQQAGFIALFA